MHAYPDKATFAYRPARFRTGMLLTFLVLAVSLALTYQLWEHARQTAAQALQTVFEHRVREAADHIERRMLSYQQILRGVDGLFARAEAIDRDKFRDYVARLKLEESYAGIQGIGYAQVVPRTQKDLHIAAIRRQGFPAYTIKPEGDRDIYTSVIYLEPFNERNQRAFGYDMYSDNEHPRPGDLFSGTRHAAMEQARDTGKPAISGKVRLLMELETDQNPQAGFLMYLPVYKFGMPHTTLAERRTSIAGWVYAPFRMNDLMTGIFGKYMNELDISIYDNKNISEQAQMYGQNNGRHRDNPSKAMFAALKHIEITGHTWSMSIRSRPPFEAQLDNTKANFIAYTGIVISLLLALLTWLLALGRERAMLAARKMNRKLIRSEGSLRSLFDNASEGIWVIGADQRTVKANRALSGILGISESELPGKSIYGFVDEEDIGAVQSYLADSQGSSIEQHFEIAFKRADGQKIFCQFNASPILDEHGNRTGAFALVTDITERIQAKTAIERISSLYKMLSDMNSANIHASDRDSVFNAACRIAMESGLFCMAWIGLLNPENGSVVAVAQAGHVDGYLDKLDINIYHPKTGNRPTGTAIMKEVHVYSNDIASDPHMQPWREEALKRGYRASAVFPLQQSGEIIGAFNLYFSDSKLLTADVIQLIDNLVDDISFTLDFIAGNQQREQVQNELRELSVFLQASLESERKRIARELHDELGQTMTALHFDLKWLHENIREQEHEVHNKLSSMQGLAARTVDAIRRISEDLRPGMLDDLGLAAAIEHHVTKFSAQTGIACDLAMSQADFELDEPVATALFRIVQETLTNVARHSGARNVTIRLQDLGDQILLIVQDDGRGLPAQQDTDKKTYGLLGMRERVRILNGTLDMFNEAGAGARIETCIPKHIAN